ncbi:hypothetical protein AQUCO_01400365v1 [Aquilegia coerulea]|uniref:Uncharacterized protein n=1 Tax=Aquilegia coerulea TaxID=218851 RepID=A0A2G5DW16_AQUCA|nr:hypothetical protein AQUCO_01400365v1 [Aquilegia coerulea]
MKRTQYLCWISSQKEVLEHKIVPVRALTNMSYNAKLEENRGQGYALDLDARKDYKLTSFSQPQFNLKP